MVILRCGALPLTQVHPGGWTCVIPGPMRRICTHPPPYKLSLQSMVKQEHHGRFEEMALPPLLLTVGLHHSFIPALNSRNPRAEGAPGRPGPGRLVTGFTPRSGSRTGPPRPSATPPFSLRRERGSPTNVAKLGDLWDAPHWIGYQRSIGG